MRFLLACLVLAAAPAGAQSAAPSDADVKALGAQMTRWVLAGEADSLIAHMSPQLLQGIGGKAAVEAAASDLAINIGKETAVLMETVTRGQGVPEYWRLARYSEAEGEPFVWHWVFGPDGLAAGVGFTPLSDTPAAQ